MTSETDELGRQTLYDIDPLTGDVRAMTQVVGAVGGDDDLVTRYTYTPQGLVDLVTDLLGRVTDYDYDAQGRQSKVTVAKGTPDEASQQSVYDAAGNPIATIDENGNRTEYTYDALNRVVKTTMAVGTSVQATQQVEYDAAGNQIATIDENGKRTEYVYDAMGQLVQTTTPDPDDGGLLSASVTTSVYDAAGNQTATVDALGRRTQYRYDARNRLIETIHPDGSRETLGYDVGDNNTESTDAKGRKTTRVYDPRGRLIRTIDPLGGSTQFEYDINNQLIAQIDANGNRTEYTYDELGRQVSVKDALGNSSTTQYDKIGNTIAETDTLNRTTRHSYDNRDRQIALTTPLGLVNRTVYDKVGNVIQAIDPLNRSTRYTFDPRNRQIEVTDPLNQKATTAYDAIGNVTSTTDELGHTTRFAYDGLNRQIEVIDALNGNVKTAYDAKDNVISVTNPLGKVTRYGYDSRDRRTTVTDARGGVTTTTYDTVGNVLTITDPTITAPPQPPQTTTLVTIGSDGTPANGLSDSSSISGDGRFVAFRSNASNLVPNDTNNAPDIFVRDLQAGTTKLISVGINGELANSYSESPKISSNGRYIIFNSFASNLVPGDTNNSRDIFVYDRQTNQITRIAERTLDWPGDISGDGRFITFSSSSNDLFIFDRQTNQSLLISPHSFQPSISDDGRFVAFTSGLALAPGDFGFADYSDIFVYDRQAGTITLASKNSAGQAGNSQDLNPSISNDGRYIAFLSDSSNLVAGDTNNSPDIFVHDLQTGQTIRITDTVSNQFSGSTSISEDGRFVAFSSNSNNLVLGDTNNTIDIFISDSQAGTTTRVSVDSDGNQANSYSESPTISSDGRFVAFSSSAENLVPGDTNLSSDIFVVGPLPSSSTILPSAKFRYDANDRLVTETNSLGATRTSTYDAAGNRTSLTDRNGKTRRFSFDPLNRLTTETWIGDGRTINSTFDAAGQLTQINDADATYNYAYDLDGRLLSVNNTGTAGSPSVVMSYGYDAAGNMLSATDSINGTPGSTNTYTFDPLNRMTRMQQSGTGVANKRVDYAYNAVGQPINVKRFSDLAGTQPVAETTHSFDSLNRLTGINHSKGGVPLSSYDYSFDANSRITGVTSRDGTSINTYDDTDQLTGVDHSFQPDEAYTYDANGNRTNPGYVTGANNRLLSDGKFNYEYDGEGNRVKQTDILTGAVTEYGWDYRNRLTQVVEKNASGTVINQSSHTYDPNDLRIGRTENGIAERFVYGQNQNIALEFDGSGSLTNRYLHGDDIDTLLADEPTSGSVLWTFGDNLGTVRDVTDNSGTVSNHLTYGAFGNVTNETNPSSGMRFGFTGRDLDRDSGLNYYRGRYYGSDIGRFISEDRIGFKSGDTNLYRYVFNNPIDGLDPNGEAGVVLSQQRRVRYFDFKGRSRVTNDIQNVIDSYNKNSVKTTIFFDETNAEIKYVPGFAGQRSKPPNPPGLRELDARGHIVAHQFGGSDTDINNFFAQNYVQNGFFGSWYDFELRIAQYFENMKFDRACRMLAKVILCPCLFKEEEKEIKAQLRVKLHYGNDAINALRPVYYEASARFSDGGSLNFPLTENS